MKLTALSLAALAGLSQAVEVQVVSVGKNSVNGQTGLKYYPEQITAKPGTMVQFQFLDGNHTVTQSNFDNPCEPLAKSTPGSTGFKSGFQPVKASADKGQLPVFTIMVKDTKPIWVFCGQGPHCQKGMAMVINQNPASNNTKTLDEYKKKAAGTTPASGGSPPPSNGGSNNSSPPPSNGAATSSIVTQPSGTKAPSPSTPVTAGASAVGGSLSVLAAIGAALLLV